MSTTICLESSPLHYYGGIRLIASGTHVIRPLFCLSSPPSNSDDACKLWGSLSQYCFLFLLHQTGYKARKADDNSSNGPKTGSDIHTMELSDFNPESDRLSASSSSHFAPAFFC